MVTIQPFDPGFTEAIVQMILDIQVREFNVPITRQDQPDLDRIPEVYEQNKGNFFVALYDGKVVGTIAAIDFGDDMLALRKMFVHADFRGKTFGTAQLLLETMLRWSAENKVRAIYLGTLEKFVAAGKFYHRNGFEVVSKTALPANFPRMPLDDLFFKKTLLP